MAFKSLKKLFKRKKNRAPPAAEADASLESQQQRSTPPESNKFPPTTITTTTLTEIKPPKPAPQADPRKSTISRDRNESFEPPTRLSNTELEEANENGDAVPKNSPPRRSDSNDIDFSMKSEELRQSTLVSLPPATLAEKQTPSFSGSSNTIRTSNNNRRPGAEHPTASLSQSLRPPTLDEEERRRKDRAVQKIQGRGVSASFQTPPLIREPSLLSPQSQPPQLAQAYEAIPMLEHTKLPRGGISFATKAVGRVQFGIPPETIKDSMTLGIPVPQVYIVPAERFCREMGPALGVNLAEFEFPAYFNFFVYKKQCTLVVDSSEAQDNICRVFGETLLGPAQFRQKAAPKVVKGDDDDVIDYAPEDFADDFPKDKIPNLRKELAHFRKLPDGSELVLEKLLDFCQFQMPGDGASHEELGVPPGMAHVVKEIERESGTANDNDLSAEDIGDAVHVPKDLEGVENMVEGEKWSYKKARWAGDVATVWPPGATEEQKQNRSVPRVEIFKMPSGTDYILHDVDVNNHIIGKARFAGHVKVSESMGVNGFGQEEVPAGVEKKVGESKDGENDSVHSESSGSMDELNASLTAPPTFHAPSFGVTVLGNSHGFDKNGSVSGYVLWINGRGVMIDPPPYASATLEREGIRPRMIVGIILTHCHADHDAGAFQKVLTGSQVVVITTPTIYKSFIRKYAALASLSPALLRHSHRHKPAIIGQALRFQGATFYFTYSLHTIPCIAFRVEWRGRSIVFTGDHFNSPEGIDKLEASGVLSKGRADDLRQLPLQETDVLLHESGAPPIHTPLDVLLKLPQRVKQRMYVVHTSSLPEGCELKVAPTGTKGTIRLDTVQRNGPASPMNSFTSHMAKHRQSRDAFSLSMDDDDLMSTLWGEANNEYEVIDEESEDLNADDLGTSFSHVGRKRVSFSRGGAKKNYQRTSLLGIGGSQVPLVSLRPASSTDAWFILNLLSSVPFMSSLSYASTMEVLEIARVDAFCKNDVVLHHKVRKCTLCVIWEGTCVERQRSPPTKQTKEIERHPDQVKGTGSARSAPSSMNSDASPLQSGAVWHAGDWTGPIALQPDKHLSGESDTSETHSIVAESSEGVKVITVEFAALQSILKRGSALYRKYLERRIHQSQQANMDGSQSTFSSLVTHKMLTDAVKKLNVVDLLDRNSALQRLSAVQKRHLECLAEGPVAFGPGDRLWRSGEPVTRAFLVVAGTTSFVQRRRNAGSASLSVPGKVGASRNMSSQSKRSSIASNSSVNDAIDEMGADMMRAIEELGDTNGDENIPEVVISADDHIHLDSLFSRNSIAGGVERLSEAQDYAKLSKDLQRRADMMHAGSQASDLSLSSSVGSESTEKVDHESDSGSAASRSRRESMIRRRSSRARHNNKVLCRLYSRRAFTGNLVFSKGHFLGDVSKMVAGLLLSDQAMDPCMDDREDSLPSYGFGDKLEGGRGIHDEDGIMDNLTDMVIHEQEPDSRFVHTSTLAAGKEGCVVLFFPKSSLIPFLDEFPGLLLSLLGTQVVV